MRTVPYALLHSRLHTASWLGMKVCTRRSRDDDLGPQGTHEAPARRVPAQLAFFSRSPRPMPLSRYGDSCLTCHSSRTINTPLPLMGGPSGPRLILHACVQSGCLILVADLTDLIGGWFCSSLRRRRVRMNLAQMWDDGPGSQSPSRKLVAWAI
ncbi:unnamed protein product [Mycena citricolor]|uniref:Uncharacterized protein n=1 Tax=Mycena citricolor TaxID=2018698 RepID=A0AAD2JXG4_9AGAR|nr:unnamed protein product [Mycena citricolor]